uniref:Tumor necrosis factor receptor-associated factor 4 n=1 Tax=Branchiostoma belcheri TaxID=7741 RepID=A2TK69_BRABE|nr:tumor necrosis factor receptor-associated factor 4 [Branchiostoma belcheri]
MPGLQHTFADRVRRRWLCPLCHLHMNDPVQITTCGHRFCDTCLQEFLSEGVFECPEDKLALDYAKIYPDEDMHEEILNTKVRCSHWTDGCYWVDKVTRLQDHLRTCKYTPVQCPNDCSALLTRLRLDDHLEHECSRRQCKCEFCGMRMSYERMEHHEGNCPQESVYCENKCGARMLRRFLSNHTVNECAKRTVPCPHCGKQFLYDTLPDHSYNCPRFPVSCPNRCDPTKIPREEVEQHLHDNCPSTMVACPFYESGCKHKCPRNSLDRHLQQESESHLKLMCQLVNRQKNDISQLRNQLQTVTTNQDGTLLWKIADIDAKFKEAKASNNCELVSPPFFTGKHGYKLSLSVFLNGNGSGEGSHLSLYVRLLPGEYDSLLQWPFTHAMTFMVMDQGDPTNKREHLTESFIPDPTWKHFQKPSHHDKKSLGFGYPQFVSHHTLKTRGYIVDDCLFIKCIVDPSRIVEP